MEAEWLRCSPRRSDVPGVHHGRTPAKGSPTVKEYPMFGKKKKKSTAISGVDPRWPVSQEGGHPVSDLNSDRQGALSPFGDLNFPLAGDQIPYVHPVTVINR